MQRTAEHPTGEGTQDRRQKHRLRRQPDIARIRNPELVYTGQPQAAPLEPTQVWGRYCGECMGAVWGRRSGVLAVISYAKNATMITSAIMVAVEHSVCLP